MRQIKRCAFCGKLFFIDGLEEVQVEQERIHACKKCIGRLESEDGLDDSVVEKESETKR